MTEAPNPYAAPHYDEDSPPAHEETEAERVRREHLSHEASLRSWGMIYLIAGGYCLIGTIAGLVAAIAALVTDRFGQGITLRIFGITLFYGVLCAALLTIGIGLRRLNPKIKLPAIIVTALGLLAFPCGTLVNVYVLDLLLCRKGQTILSAEYAEVVRQTPHIAYRAPRFYWIVVCVALAAVAGLLLVAGWYTRF